MVDLSNFSQQIQKELKAVQARGKKDCLAKKPPNPPQPQYLNDYHDRRDYLATFIGIYCQGYGDEVKPQKTTSPETLTYSEAVSAFQDMSSGIVFKSWATNFGNGVKAALDEEKQIPVEALTEDLAEFCFKAAHQGVIWTKQCQEHIQSFEQNQDTDLER